MEKTVFQANLEIILTISDYTCLTIYHLTYDSDKEIIDLEIYLLIISNNVIYM